MIRSMTGFGMGTAQGDGLSVQAELHCVNHKQLSIAISLPNSLLALESKATALVEEAFSRGRINLVVRLMPGSVRTGRFIINEHLAKDAIEAWRNLARAEWLDDTPRLGDILRIPGVIELVQLPLDLDSTWSVLKQALQEAVRAAQGMREAEGARLFKDILRLCEEIRVGTESLERTVAQEAPEVQSRILDKMRLLLSDTKIEPSMVMNEAALLAMKADISEEICRIKSHLVATSQLESTEDSSPGRKLDFIAQEIARETSTIASKSGIWHVSEQVVSLRTLAESIRQQASNIE